MTTRGINRATVLGYLGRDPRITTTVNGGLRAHISIATTEMWQNENDETVERIDWHQIVAFGRFAEVIRDHCGERFPPPWGEKRDSSENPGAQSDAVDAVPDELPPMDDLPQPDEPFAYDDINPNTKN